MSEDLKQAIEKRERASRGEPEPKKPKKEKDQEPAPETSEEGPAA
jgi:hypothetical protein